MAHIEKLYEQIIHDYGRGENDEWYPRGVILDKVITDEGYWYNFFGKSHRVEDSGYAYIYELPGETNGENNISGLKPDPDDEDYSWLNAHMILDYCPEELLFDDFEGYTSFVGEDGASEGTGVFPSLGGWTFIRKEADWTNRDSEIWYNPAFGHSGSYSFRLYGKCIVGLPEITLPADVELEDLTISMWLRQPNTVYKLQVGIWDGTDFTSLHQFSSSTSDPEYHTWNFSDYPGTIPSGRLAFRNTGSSYAYSYNYIDDLKITVSPKASLATHIVDMDEPTYYQQSLEEVINNIDNGARIMFAVLFNLYYYNLQKPGWYWDRTNFNFTGIWSQAVDYAGVGKNPDYADYIQANGDYHPDYTMSHPGAVYECFKGCLDDEYYTIKSCNGFDSHEKYTVTRSALEYILRGNRYGLTRFLCSTSIYGQQMNILATAAPGGYELFDGTTSPSYGRYKWPWSELNAPLLDVTVDRDMILTEILDSQVYTDPDTHDEYSMDEYLYDDGAPIDNWLNYPVFVTYTGQAYHISEEQNFTYFNNLPQFGSEVWPLYITINWNDDSCRAFRPDTASIDICIYHRSTMYTFATIGMSMQSNRVDEYTWKYTMYLPCKYFDNADISWYAAQKPLPYGASAYTTQYPYTTAYGPSTIPYNGVDYVHLTGNGSYMLSITNSIPENPSGFSSQIPITITKIWGDINCSNCHQTITGTVTPTGETAIPWSMEDYTHPATVSIPWSNVNPSGITIVEDIGDLSNDYYCYIYHSDNCLNWTIYNIPKTWPNVRPIDNTNTGNLFYFELDQECLGVISDISFAGFRIEGGWGANEGVALNPIAPIGWDGCLCYKIIEVDDNFDQFIPGSDEYYKFILEGWQPYYRFSGIEQALHWKDNGDAPFEFDISHTNVGKDGTVSGTDVFSGVLVPTPESGKIRIYIAACKEFHHRLSSNGQGFKATSLRLVDDVVTYNNSTINCEPDSSNVPLRIGGELGTLYGVNDDILSKTTPNYSWIDGGANWFVIRARLYNEHDYNGDRDYIVADSIKKRHSPGAGLHDIDYTIHDLYFNFPSSWAYRDRWVLYDEDCISVPDWIPAFGAITGILSIILGLLDNYGAINILNISPGYRLQKIYDDNNSGMWGDLFDRLFINMLPVVDASQLLIPQVYTDMQYHRTFMNSGIGNPLVNPAKSIHSTPYLPYYDTNASPAEKVFAPFKDMYRGCSHLQEIGDAAIMLENMSEPVPGMHYYDNMFRDSGLETININLPLSKNTPWGVCRGMFAGCKSCSSVSAKINIAQNIGPSAFMFMFRESTGVPFQTMPDAAPDTMSFYGMYMGAVGPASGYSSYCDIPDYLAKDGTYARMFMWSSGYRKIRINNTNQYREWTFTQMMRASDVRVIDMPNMTRWDKRAYAFRNWVWEIYGSTINTNPQTGDREFRKKKKLNKVFNRDRIPRKKKKWCIYNYT